MNCGRESPFTHALPVTSVHHDLFITKYSKFIQHLYKCSTSRAQPGKYELNSQCMYASEGVLVKLRGVREFYILLTQMWFKAGVCFAV